MDETVNAVFCNNIDPKKIDTLFQLNINVESQVI